MKKTLTEYELEVVSKTGGKYPIFPDIQPIYNRRDENFI